MVDSSFSIQQEMFNGIHYGKKMARLAIAGFSANVGNVRYTDHSIKQTPPAGMADFQPAETSFTSVASSAEAADENLANYFRHAIRYWTSARKSHRTAAF